MSIKFDKREKDVLKELDNILLIANIDDKVDKMAEFFKKYPSVKDIFDEVMKEKRKRPDRKPETEEKTNLNIFNKFKGNTPFIYTIVEKLNKSIPDGKRRKSRHKIKTKRRKSKSRHKRSKLKTKYTRI